MDSTDRSLQRGLLLLRLGFGIMFLLHGAPKLFGGPEIWGKIGTAIGHLGIHTFPVFWGLMAACSEFLGSVCLIFGLWFRPACVFMACTMAVATATHLANGDPFAVFSHPIEAAIVFLSLLVTGPGSYSIERAFFSRPSDPSRYTLP